MTALAATAHTPGVRLARHDDDTAERVIQMDSLGVRVSEFPTTLAAAQTASALGMTTLVGAPNLLRGQSQSQSLLAQAAIEAGVAGALCSDYAPATLLAAVLRLPTLVGWTPPQAMRLVTLHPAQAVGLADRGELAVGKRADCIAVRHDVAYPQVMGVWVAAGTVLATSPHPPPPSSAHVRCVAQRCTPPVQGRWIR